MASATLLERGFKAKAERRAVDFRTQMSLQPWSPLCAFKLASHLNVTVWSAADVIGSDEELYRLAEGIDLSDCGWSALTMTNSLEQRIVLHNHKHGPARQQSNIMHELAHFLCGHEAILSEEAIKVPFQLRKHDKKQEEEANCLGGTLQLPQPSLLWAKRQGMSNEVIASYFNASIEMVDYRLRITGVERRMSYQN